MEFQVLGPIRVSREDGAVSVSGSLQRRLLAVLLARAGELVPADQLADALWPGNSHPGGQQRLQLHVSRLRRLLGDPARISFDQDGYRLRVLAGELDVERFGRLVGEASAIADADPQRCAGLVREALGLWRGRPFGDLDVPVLADESRRLAECRLSAMELLFEAELRCGRHAAVIMELMDLVRAHPLRERLCGLLMTALYRSGRQADALAVFRDTRRTLVDELGLEPGPELRAIERRILAGEEVELGAAATSLAVPAALPHNVPGFVGRETELSTLDDLHAAGSEAVRICVLAGTAGVGKTALAIRWAHKARDAFADGQLYVDLRGYGPDQPVSPADALAGFLRELGVDGTAIPSEVDERAARFRSLVDRRRLLVVLDNARTVDQIRPLLPGSPSCVVLITSRDSLMGLAAREGAHRIPLGRLQDGDARALLCGLIGARADAEPAAIERLVEACARLPLALRIAAELIKGRPGMSVAELVAELGGERGRLDLLDVDGDPHASVRAVFSWSYHHLPPDIARLFRLCGLHPGHDLDVYALAALAGTELPTARRWLDVLVRAHLVEETPDRRLHLHDLLCAYAAELNRAMDTEADREAALTRLYEYYLHAAALTVDQIVPHEGELRSMAPTPIAVPELTTYQEALRWLDAERPNLMLVADQAADRGMSTYTTGLSAALWRYLDVGVYLDEARRLHTKALAVARDRGDRAAEGIALRGLGLVDLRFDRYDLAVVSMEQAVAVHEELGDKQLLATTLNYLAGGYLLTGRIDDSIRLLRRSLDLYRELGHQSLQARPLSNLGFVYRRLGRHDEAFHCLERALAIAEENDHRLVQAHALQHLAMLCAEVERYDEAIGYSDRALSLARDSGVRNIEGSILNNLGTVYRRLGDHEKAVRHHHEALASARANGDSQLLARALNGLAQTQVSSGAWADAARLFGEALAVASANGIRPEQAVAHVGLGDACAERGDQDRATEHWRWARDIYRELGTPEVSDVDKRLDG